MDSLPIRTRDVTPLAGAGRVERTAPAPGTGSVFEAAFVALFDARYDRLCRVVARLGAEPELAADVVQEAFIRLYQRRSLPDSPEGWLISVALNLFRNAMTTRSRRRERLTLERGLAAHSDAALAPDTAVSVAETRRRVRAAIDRLPARERELLLLRAAGYAYRDIAAALELKEGSIGTLLARARLAFRRIYEDADHAP